ncbi:PRC-barrel domain-containing protein [Microbacterium sp.]|uniref:PRC-barrel domain-containing protein n=1 Tax=Microbacterium sp. TaxID=51671 RepID=UPI0028B12EB2|nr:PRC-barrel domain-containing protein [Microbacterium sp.]
MIDSYKINSLFDADVVDADGSKIGTVKHVYVDPDGGQPLFAGVTTGWFGASESFVPLRDADFDGEVIHVRYDEDTVKHAPRIDADGVMTDDDIDRIHDYYNGESPVHESAGGHDDDERRRADERDASQDDALTTHPVVVNDQRPPRKRIRIHRYVLADEQTAATPLSHGDATPERGPIVDQARYQAADEPPVDRLDEPPASASDGSRDSGTDELRRRRT